MRAEDVKALPEKEQLIVLELMRIVDEMKLLRQEIVKLRMAIGNEIE